MRYILLNNVFLGVFCFYKKYNLLLSFIEGII